jgi:two-component system, OmpR family, sensor kinase
MSIRLRLAIWYGGLSALLVVVVCVYAYSVHVRTRYDELDRMLQARLEHLGDMLDDASTSDARRGVLGMAAPLGLAVRVYDSSGSILLEQANADRVPDLIPRELRRGPSIVYSRLIALTSSPRVSAKNGAAWSIGTDDGAQRWRAYMVRLPSGQFVIGSVSLAQVDSSVQRYGLLLLTFGIFGASGAFVIGWLIAGHALRPVAQLTATARQIAQSGEPSRRVPLSRERDELGQLASTFNEMLASLEAAQLAQQRFVSDASHEIRAPLTVIQANLELLDRADALPPTDRKDAIVEARSEAARLARLVADLLALARADAGVQLRRSRVELDRLVMDAIGEARHLLDGQRLEITALEPTTVLGDADRLKQLLLVLLDNAARYTPPSGRISVALGRDDEFAKITVADTGIGIAPDDIGRVFERFYRADRARSREPGGTGLGLPIARWIATQHAGTVDLESDPSEGTTARIRLPLS